jgi:hypothetical protein
MLGSGFRVLGSGFRVLGSGLRVLGLGCWVPDAGCWVQGGGRGSYLYSRSVEVFKPSLQSSPVTPPKFRPFGQPETRFADEKVVTQ